MPEDNIVINSYNDGSMFNTNIKTLDEHTLLYGSIRPYFHKCGFTTDVKFVAGTVHSFKVFNEKLYYWILGIISSDDFHRHTNTKSQGTKMPIINWEAFIDYNVPIIDDDSLIQFNEKIDPLYKIIIEKMKQNRKLECIKKQYLNKFFG